MYFGQLPDVLEDVWINVAIGEQEKALEIIDNVPEKHPFENRYNMGVEHIDWESCSEVLDKKEKREFLEEGLDKVYECIMIYCSDRTPYKIVYMRDN